MPLEVLQLKYLDAVALVSKSLANVMQLLLNNLILLLYDVKTKNRQVSIDDVDPFTKQDFQVKAPTLYDMSYRHALTTIVFDDSDTGETTTYLGYL